MKKYTVKELAHLLESNGLIEVVFENDYEWYYKTLDYTIDEIVNKYGERVITWITYAAEDGDERLIIELEGDRE